MLLLVEPEPVAELTPALLPWALEAAPPVESVEDVPPVPVPGSPVPPHARTVGPITARETRINAACGIQGAVAIEHCEPFSSRGQ
jgi:hypothetical protein